MAVHRYLVKSLCQQHLALSLAQCTQEGHVLSFLPGQPPNQKQGVTVQALEQMTWREKHRGPPKAQPLAEEEGQRDALLRPALWGLLCSNALRGASAVAVVLPAGHRRNHRRAVGNLPQGSTLISSSCQPFQLFHFKSDYLKLVGRLGRWISHSLGIQSNMDVPVCAEYGP